MSLRRTIIERISSRLETAVDACAVSKGAMVKNLLCCRYGLFSEEIIKVETLHNSVRRLALFSQSTCDTEYRITSPTANHLPSADMPRTCRYVEDRRKSANRAWPANSIEERLIFGLRGRGRPSAWPHMVNGYGNQDYSRRAPT